MGGVQPNYLKDASQEVVQFSLFTAFPEDKVLATTYHTRSETDIYKGKVRLQIRNVMNENQSVYIWPR